MHILSFEIYVYKLATLCATPSFCDQTKDFSFSSAHSKRGSAGRGAWLYADLCKCRATISNKKKKKIAKKTKGIREPRGDVWQKEMKENCALEKRPNRCQQQKCKSKGVKKKMKKKENLLDKGENRESKITLLASLWMPRRNPKWEQLRKGYGEQQGLMKCRTHKDLCPTKDASGKYSGEIRQTKVIRGQRKRIVADFPRISSKKSSAAFNWSH